MATITSAATGNWSDGSTWVGGSVPANGDAVVIASPHVVTFNVDQSGMAAGISTLTINAGATLQWSTEASKNYYMKLSSGVTCSGTFRIGNSASDRIPRSSTATFFCSGSATYSVQQGGSGVVEVWGWIGTINHTFLSSSAGAGTSTLVLRDDLDLQTGDTIVVGAIGDSVTPSAETTKGAYTVQSYVSGTKTVTLTGTLGIDRPTGMVVARLSRNVIFYGTAASASYSMCRTTAVSGAEFVIDNTTRRGAIREPYGGVDNSSLRGANSVYGLVYSSNQKTVSRCTAQGQTYGAKGCSTTTFSELVTVCVSYPTSAMSSCPLLNCVFSMFDSGAYLSFDVTMVDCIGHGVQSGMVREAAGVNHLIRCTSVQNTSASPVATIGYLSSVLAADCVFSMGGSSGRGTTSPFDVTLRNCLLDVTSEVVAFSRAYSSPWSYVESFDHDQVVGAFRSWTVGGITSSVVDVVVPGRVRSYKCPLSYADDWGFMQRFVMVEPGETLRVRAWLRSDYTGDTRPQAQLVAVDADPLRDPSASALASAVSPNVADTWSEHALTWTNGGSSSREIIIRLMAKRASGNAWFDCEWGLGHVGRGWHGWS